MIPIHPYEKGIKTIFKANANAANAAPMKAYMKHLFEYHGLKSPDRRTLQTAYIKEKGLPPMDELETIIMELWALPEREYHYFALDILLKMVKKLNLSHLPMMEKLVLEKSWWDTVDTLASNLIGPMLLGHPKEIAAANKRWNKSGNMWLQRTGIIFQLNYKDKTDTDLLYANILTHADSKEFFLRKAIGWALRQYARTDAAAVKQFVEANELSPLSVREAMKHIL